MNNPRYMSELKVGQQAKILELNIDNQIFQRRMSSLGLIVGSTIKCVIQRGETACYRICGAVIAVRSEDVSKIVVDILE